LPTPIPNHLRIEVLRQPVESALDTTIVNVALDTLGRALHAPITTGQWAITGYLLAMGMAMPATGWLAERFGSKRMWLFSLTLFLVGSALSGRPGTRAA
jgi:MFS family permease